MKQAPLLQVSNLKVEFKNEQQWVQVVDQFSLTLQPQQILAIVGESGCGKSVSCMALGKLLSEDISRITGEVVLNTPEECYQINQLNDSALQKVRGRHLAYIFQDPAVCLNPVIKIKHQICEVFKLHQPNIQNPLEKAEALLKAVGIPEPQKRLNAYPHELSGGMQQRIMIAIALAGNPSLLIADEPTTALDVTVQAQVLKLIKSLKKEHKMGVLLITHNFGLVGELADRVAVMYAGQIIEEGTRDELILQPAHPYTHALIQSVPILGAKNENLHSISGRVPSPQDYVSTCRFQPRCEKYKTLTPQQQQQCLNHIPCSQALSSTHLVQCHFPFVKDIDSL